MALTAKPNRDDIFAYRYHSGRSLQESKKVLFRNWTLENMQRLRGQVDGPLADLIELLIEERS